MRPQPPACRPVEIVPQADMPPRPTPVLVLDSLARMHPATAVTIVLTTAGMVVGGVVAIVALVAAVLTAAVAVAGMVTMGAISLAVIALVLSRPAGHR